MHWSNGLLSMLSDDLICILSGQSQVKVPGWMIQIFFWCSWSEYKKSYATIKTEQKVDVDGLDFTI